METEVTKESVVCGHHTYKEVWQPVIGIKRLLSRIYAVRKEHASDRWGTLNNKVHLINQFYSINIIINGWLLKMRDKWNYKLYSNHTPDPTSEENEQKSGGLQVGWRQQSKRRAEGHIAHPYAVWPGITAVFNFWSILFYLAEPLSSTNLQPLKVCTLLVDPPSTSFLIYTCGQV